MRRSESIPIFRVNTVHTIFSLNIATPYLVTILVLKFKIVHSTTGVSLKYSCMFGKQLDPDQMLHPAASDLGVHCLLRPLCRIITGTPDLF